ncbi:hypothetical protein Moror_12434 [Moniliophthora roreri MCA 2997]|uniref:Uncharacterized protein n=2 Tax=Moniliophthora roreri TaxID=221103 RepID=V2XQ15_MONRO|nr:hypothetical protein Moror_12434 [Moniliophthora roreri MCA 2997]KAI3616057.1 hypothetical protein WG66_014020 [Moniliophthora roreri]
MLLPSLTFTISCLFNVAVHALPLEPRIVFNPKITSPNEQTVWEVGSQQSVTWDPTGLPDETLTGQAILGFLEGDSPNEHLMLDNPLAKSFLIKDGKAEITVPDVPERDSYIVVVFGDSGNASPRFTIKGGSGNPTSSTAAPSTTTIPSSTVAAPPSTVSGTSASPTTTGVTTTVVTFSTAPAPTTVPTSVATVTSTSPATTATAPTSAPLSSAPGTTVIVLPSTATDTTDAQGSPTPAAVNTPPNNAALTTHMSFELTLSVIATTTILLFTTC